MPSISPLLNTLTLTLATLALAVPAGTALAWLLVRSDVPLRRLGRLLLGIMLFVPLFLQTAAWQAGFGLEGWYTLASGRAPLLDGIWAAIWIHTMAELPWVVFFIGVGLRLVEPELEEQAMLDGTPWQVFRYATLPNMWGAVALAALWVTMQTAGEMTVTDFFAVRTLAENTYTTIVAGDNPAASLRAMLPVTLLVAAGLAAALRLVALRSNDRPLSMRRELIFAAGPWRWPLAMVLASVLLLIVGVPLGNLICKAGWKVVAMGPERVRYWSLEKCLTMIVDAPSRCPHEIFWTFVICVSAASTAVVIGGAVTWFARLNAVMRWPLAVFTGLGLALPGPMLGLAIVFMLNRPELPWLADLNDHSILAPWLALTVRATPPALVLLWHAWATLPDDVLAAAALDSAGPVRQFMAVAVPQRWPAIAAAWLLAFAMAMGDLAAGILVVPPGVTTLAIHIFQLLHFGVEDQVAGLCLAMLLFFTSIGLVVRWLFASKIGRS